MGKNMKEKILKEEAKIEKLTPSSFHNIELEPGNLVDSEIFEYALSKIGISPLRTGMLFSSYGKEKEDRESAYRVLFDCFKAGIVFHYLHPTVYKIEDYKNFREYLSKLEKKKKEEERRTLG